MSGYCVKDLSTHVDSGAMRPDHWMNIAHLSYFRYATRSEAEAYLGQSIRKFIIRNCNDPSEFIQGIPNPNLFVISYRDADPIHPGAFVFCHAKFLRVPPQGITLSNKVTESTRFFPSISEMLANSSIYYITPYTQ
jgi:hypothetical protein